MAAAELLRYRDEVADCTKCALSQGRTQVVFGAGSPSAELMFVGEAPGFHEDKQGVPFVGAAGQLLTKLLAEIGIAREDVYINNVLMCRPPGNRDPQPEEIDECTPWLMRQVQLVEPRVICTLGNVATKLITQSNVGITKCCGAPQEREVAGVPVTVYPLFHPAAALRTPAVLQRLREDFSRIPELLAKERAEEPAHALVGEAVSEEPPQLDLFG